MNKNLRAASYMALLAIGCMLTIAPAHAQSVYGSIFGTVTDKTGAVVPGATVTATDEAKGTVETVVTNDTGDYTISHLVPDTYDIKIETKGFETFVSKGVTVLADTSPRVDAALTIGGGGTTVTVDADTAPQLKTDRADVSTVFDSQQVEDLPVEGQNFTNLQLLLPGAQLLGWSHAADENPQASRQIQIDGQAFGGVAYELDGTDNQDPILGIIVVNPSLDSITEAKITTQNFDAELGKAVSAVMTVQTKSGSNSIHGSAYDFRTGNANLARDPISQPDPDSIAPGIKNKFGGSFGGPIFKDRLFYFGAYEGQRQKVGTSFTNTLPSLNLTESCLGNTAGSGGGVAGDCDFSEYLANLPGGPGSPGASPYPQGAIYDLSKPWAVNPKTGVLGPVPYPNNVIPHSQVSQQFVGLLGQLEPYVKQESGGSLGGLASNSPLSGTGLFNSDLWTVRFDDTISSKMNAFVRFSRWTDTLSGTQMYGKAGGPGFGIGNYGGQSTSADDSLAVGADYILNPKLITDLRLGYLRYNIIDVKNDQNVAAASALGVLGINMGTTSTNGSPGYFVASLPQGTQPQYGDSLSVARCNCPLTEREDQFQIVNNWTKTWGNHSVKMGADLRYGRNLRVPSDSDRAGLLTFGTAPTSYISVPSSPQGGPTYYQGGLGFATFALGDVTNFARYVSTSTNAKEFQKRTFFYAQDTWRASNKLTLNLGVRWEIYFPESVNGAGNGSLMNLDDGYLHVAGIGGIGTNMGWNIELKKQFEPRIGIAYQVDPKTVIRGGYGRSFDIGVFGSIFGHVVTQNLPVLANQSINATSTNTAFCIGSPGDNPGCTQPGSQPATGGPIPYTAPPVPSNGLLPNPGYAVNTKARPNPLHFPTLDAWNMSLQRSLTPTLSLTLAYVGNKGTHTLGDGDSNNTNPNEAAINLPASFSFNGQSLHYDPHGPSIPDASGATNNTNYLQRYYGGKLAACSDPSYSQPDNTLPSGACGWSQGVSYYGDNQNTNFNAMQVTLAQQAWKGLAATVNYQWASAFDTNSGYYTWDPRSVYGRDSDVRQNSATAYGSYQLPFGKGKQFLQNANKAEDLLIGGFELSGTYSVSSGLPFTINANGCPNTPGSAPCYANETSRLKTKLSSYQPGKGWTFYDDQTGTGVFSQPGLDQIGNSGRNTYWGPSFYNTDLSLQKSFAVWEKVQAKFRFDAYNAVNHIPPGNPGGNVIGTQYITGEAPGPGPRQLEFALKVQF
jgi:Carboxypeptidase regulatory-like domain/TonB dependent receptor